MKFCFTIFEEQIWKEDINDKHIRVYEEVDIVHFLVGSFVAKYTDFITASLVGTESLFLVYFLILPFKIINQVSSIYYLPYLHRVFKENSQIIPVVFSNFLQHKNICFPSWQQNHPMRLWQLLLSVLYKLISYL